MPGAGMNVPVRYTINAPSKKNNRCRSSAKRVISPKADRDAAVAGLVATESLSFSESLLSRRGQAAYLAASSASILPPAASTAALAPLVRCRPLIVTARLMPPEDTMRARSAVA